MSSARRVSSGLGARRRRGSVYIIVLVTAAIVVAIGVTGLQLQRVDARNAGLEIDTGEARLAAQAAVSMGAGLMSESATWRTVAAGASGVVASGTIGRAQYGLVVTDPADSDLVDNADDPVKLSAVVTIGDSMQFASAVVSPVFTPYPILSNALTTGGALSVNSGTLTGDAGVFVIGNVSATSATVGPDVSATGTVGGASYSRSVTAGQAAPTMPAAGVIASWAAKGTRISYAGLSGAKVEKVLLSPSSNPLGGGVNGLGVYVIDCGGMNLTIENCRVRGTLVLLSVGTVTISQGVVMDPSEVGAPTLLVQGNLASSSNSTTVTESAIGVNLNPASAPWKGTSDSDTSDTYSSGLWGLVYVTGTMSVPVSTRVSVTGMVVTGGAVTVGGTMAITYDAAVAVNPPDGFRTGPVWEIQAGTWAQGTR